MVGCLAPLFPQETLTCSYLYIFLLGGTPLEGRISLILPLFSRVPHPYLCLHH